MYLISGEVFYTIESTYELGIRNKEWLVTENNTAKTLAEAQSGYMMSKVKDPVGAFIVRVVKVRLPNGKAGNPGGEEILVFDWPKLVFSDAAIKRKGRVMFVLLRGKKSGGRQ
ncbi:hypothetical protein CEXT_174931 [Caerostris extrusa]|uniref:Uncharacterized protein n=1 Tax=Caerostris extrusa TaxID=172846 RepID=A0AAV4MZW2_CAEEX|nr:hypothetical protein CEXT_174931 [Caerostris extrusa]